MWPFSERSEKKWGPGPHGHDRLTGVLSSTAYIYYLDHQDRCLSLIKLHYTRFQKKNTTQQIEKKCSFFLFIYY